MPIVAQITAAIALIAAVTMPQWTPSAPASPGTLPAQPAAVNPAPLPQAVNAVPAITARPAHLNLDVRHNFRSINLSVTVDGQSALETKLTGSGKRFGVIGKRAERGFTRTLDVTPGAHVVRVRVRSAEDKFDQTRVERFDLDSAAVASMRIAADKSGLSVVADRPSASPAAVGASVALPGEPVSDAQLPPVPQAAQLSKAAQAAEAAQSAQEASALAELYQSLRSILIAVAGFIASAATGFLVESFLRTRRALQFASTQQQGTPAISPAVERRRRRRATQNPQTPAISSE